MLQGNLHLMSRDGGDVDTWSQALIYSMNTEPLREILAMSDSFQKPKNPAESIKFN